MKQTTKQQIEEITKELNGKVQYTTVLSKTHSSKQIVITYDEQRRRND